MKKIYGTKIGFKSFLTRRRSHGISPFSPHTPDYIEESVEM